MAFEQNSVFVPKFYSCPDCGRRGTTDPISFRLIAANCEKANCPLKLQVRGNNRGCFRTMAVLFVLAIGVATYQILTANQHAAVLPIIETAGQDSDASASQNDVAADEEENDSSPVSITPEVDEISDDIGQALQGRPVVDAEIAEALRLGRAVPWSSSGRQGYVVPSAETVTTTSTCRDLVVSELDGADYRSGPPSRWCQNGDGKWAEVK